MEWQIIKREQNDEPREVVLTTPSIQITVHRHIHFKPDLWLVTTRGDVRLNCAVLLHSDLEGAKKEAIEKVLTVVARIKNELG